MQLRSHSVKSMIHDMFDCCTDLNDVCSCLVPHALEFCVLHADTPLALAVAFINFW